MRSAVILAGGQARRANGKEKYFFMYRGATFIERLIGSLSEVTDEIVIVARDPAQCARFNEIRGITCTCDIRQGIGPVGGLHAGALAAHGEFLFVSACDMPCISPDVVRHLFDTIGSHEAAIPRWNEKMLEPLHAVYRREALLGYLRSHTSLSLRAIVQSLDTQYVPVDELRPFDPDLRTFTNINKLEELEHINRQ